MIDENYNKKEKLQNLRLGDWICLNCNNLNYSFRNSCNRCQNITKQQNLILKQMMIDAYKLQIQQQQYQGFQNYLFIEIDRYEDQQENIDEKPDDEYENIYKLLVQDDDDKENKQIQMKKLQALNQRMITPRSCNIFQQENNQKFNLLMNDMLKSKKDWICNYCKNLNYSFRQKCNRCNNNYDK